MKSGKNYVSTGAQAKDVGLALDDEINGFFGWGAGGGVLLGV